MATITNDPITLEIIQNSLQSAADEMFAAMKKTAMSSIIYEVLDMGTGITDANGEIACSGAGIPAFVGVLDKAVTVIVEKFDEPGAVEPGDVFVTNDPYYGGVTHLNDIVVDDAGLRTKTASSPGPRTSRTTPTWAAWRRARSPARRRRSSRRACGCPRSR